MGTFITEFFFGKYCIKIFNPGKKLRW